ncbi:hypothetical protein LTR50_007752 [Elasticomyces elasticus]|nr:hypothetical protein LTR50_007752 [Elasticomyces elasticus]
MGLFSKLKGAKKAADQHKTQTQQPGEDKPKPAKYMHTPTHAAIDALSGAPSSWKAEDREQIIIQNKRRSEMQRVNSDYSMANSYRPRSQGNLPRASSALSMGSSSSHTYSTRASYHMPDAYPVAYTSSVPPMPPLPKHHSYTGNFSRNSGPDLRNRTSRPYFGHQVPGKSPLSTQESSPVQSEESSPASSNSSQGPFELRSHEAHYPDRDVFSQLHKNPHRKVGEAPAHGPAIPTLGPAVTALQNNVVVPATPLPTTQRRRSLFGMGKKSAVVAAH